MHLDLAVVTTEMKKVLIADTPEAFSFIEPAIGGDAAVASATTMEDALTAISDGVDHVIVGVHFDGSRMFDLVRAVRSDASLKSTSVVCVRVLGSNLAPSAYERIGVACSALEAQFIDLYSLERRFGEHGAHDEFARLLRKAIRAVVNREPSLI